MRVQSWAREVRVVLWEGWGRTRGVEDAVAVHKTLIVDADEGLRVRNESAVHPHHGLALRRGIGRAGGGGRGRVDDGASQVAEAAGGHRRWGAAVGGVGTLAGKRVRCAPRLRGIVG